MISLVIICIDNKGQNDTTIFNILDNSTELCMTKYIIGEILSSGGATLYKNPSDQTVMFLHYFSIFRALCSSFYASGKPFILYALKLISYLNIALRCASQNNYLRQNIKKRTTLIQLKMTKIQN